MYRHSISETTSSDSHETVRERSPTHLVVETSVGQHDQTFDITDNQHFSSHPSTENVINETFEMSDITSILPIISTPEVQENVINETFEMSQYLTDIPEVPEDPLNEGYTISTFSHSSLTNISPLSPDSFE